MGLINGEKETVPVEFCKELVAGQMPSLANLVPGGFRLPRVVVGYPCGGSVTVPFARSLVRLAASLAMKKERERTVTRIFEVQGLYVSQNRNAIVKDFLKNGNEEWLMQIDTDIEFGSDLIEKFLFVALQDPKMRIIAANVRLGAHKHAGYQRLGNVWAPMQEMPMGPLVPVDAAATACIMIHRTVLEEMKAKLGPVWFDHQYIQGTEDDGSVKSIEGGEDLLFCERARKMGIQTWLLRGLKLRHYKSTALVEVFDEAV